MEGIETIKLQYNLYTDRMRIKGFEFLIVPFKEFEEALKIEKFVEK